MGEDRAAEEGIVCLACGLEGEQEGLPCLVCGAQVEELDAPGEEVGLCQCCGHGVPGLSGRLGEQRAAESGMRDCRRVQGGRGDGPVQAPVRPRDGLEVSRYRGGLPGGRGLPRHGRESRGGHGRADQRSPKGVGPIAASRRGESQRLHLLAEQFGESLLYIRVRPRRGVRLPAPDLPDTDPEGSGKFLLGTVARSMTS